MNTFKIKNKHGNHGNFISEKKKTNKKKPQTKMEQDRIASYKNKILKGLIFFKKTRKSK